MLLEICIAGCWCSLSHMPLLRKKRSLQVVLPCVAPERLAGKTCRKAVLTLEQRSHDPALYPMQRPGSNIHCCTLSRQSAVCG